MLNQITDITVSHWRAVSKPRSNPAGWLSGNAVCCPHNGESADTRGRGGLLASANGTVAWHCFNCGFTTGYQPGRHLSYKFRKLLSWLGVDEVTIKRLVVEAIRIKDLAPPEVTIEVVKETTFAPRALPDGARSFNELETYYSSSDVESMPTEFADIVSYTDRRGEGLLSKYDFYWTPTAGTHRLNKRVIIPFMWGEECIGYTARAMNDNIKPKYHSSYDPNYVFNVNRQRKDSKFVIVVEGPFDAMSVDGVAVLSNECNEIKADIIDSLGKEVIVVPDFDIKNGKWVGASLVDRAIEYGWSVAFPEWASDCKDASAATMKYGKLFVLHSIIKNRHTSRLKIELMKRKYSKQ